MFGFHAMVRLYCVTLEYACVNLDGLSTEPSSVLASRIIRAHGGPSPPPRARHMASFAPSPLKDSLTFPTYDDTGAPNVDSDLGRRFRAMFDRPTPPSSLATDSMPAPPTLIIREASLSPASLLGPQVNDSQHDLISFDSFSIPSASSIPTGFAGPSIPISHPPIEILGGLLSPSPRRAASPRSGLLATDSLHPSPIRRSPRLSATPELPLIEVRNEISEPAFPQPLLSTANVNEAPQTPRRSPRRSATPQGRKPELVTPDPMPIPAPQETSRQSAEPTQTRKKWKGKAKATSPEGDATGGSKRNRDRSGSIEDGWVELTAEVDLVTETEKARGKRRQDNKEKEELTNRELGSLSPDSANVLEQLWPIQAVVSKDQASGSEDTDGHVEATPSLPLSTPIFPPKSNPLPASAQRIAVGSPVRVASPSRGPLPLNLNDTARGNARRVPINQTVAQAASVQRQGYRDSHLKPGDHNLAASLRSPVFKRPLGDSQRSPAKRVPISDATSPTKGGMIMPHGSKSPARALSRDRSASVEPRPRIPRERSGSVEHHDVRALNPPLSANKSRNTAKLPFPLIATPRSAHDRPMPIPEESESPLPTLGSTSTVHALASGSSPIKSNLKQSSTSRIPRIGAKPYTRPTSGAKDKEIKTSVAARKASTVSVPFHLVL